MRTGIYARREASQNSFLARAFAPQTNVNWLQTQLADGVRTHTLTQISGTRGRKPHKHPPPHLYTSQRQQPISILREAFSVCEWQVDTGGTMDTINDHGTRLQKLVSRVVRALTWNENISGGSENKKKEQKKKSILVLVLIKSAACERFERENGFWFSIRCEEQSETDQTLTEIKQGHRRAREWTLLIIFTTAQE